MKGVSNDAFYFFGAVSVIASLIIGPLPYGLRFAAALRALTAFVPAGSAAHQQTRCFHQPGCSISKIIQAISA